MKLIYKTALPALIFFAFTTIAIAQNLTDTFNSVESLNLTWKGYVLGAVLDESQKKTAELNPVNSTTPGTYKFNDNGLMVIADSSTDRVLILFEHFENIKQIKVQNLTGMLFMDFEEPTVSAHDKVVYWSFGKDGKFSAEAFENSKKNKKKLDILATVKLNSDIKIMEKGLDDQTGTVYYVISSDPLLKFYQ